MPFQQSVNLQPAPAVAGDFASANPRASVLAGPGALVSGPAGCIVGRFGWTDDATYSLVSNFGTGLPDGFIHREMQALITVFLAEQGSIIPPGQPMTLFNEGEFWVLNSGTNEVTPNMKAYANNGTGLVTFGVTGTPPTGGAFTASIAASTGSFTGSITDNVFTVTVVGSGTVVVGGTLAGGTTASGTQVTDQISGTPGGVGAYHVNIPGQSVVSGTITETYGTMTVTVAPTTPLGIGQVLSGTGVTAGTVITAPGTGTGGLGTYIVSPNTVVTSAANFLGAGGVETKWLSASFAAPGELVKMTSWPRG